MPRGGSEMGLNALGELDHAYWCLHHRQLAGHVNSFKMARILQHCMKTLKTVTVAYINFSLSCHGVAKLIKIVPNSYY